MSSTSKKHVLVHSPSLNAQERGNSRQRNRARKAKSATTMAGTAIDRALAVLLGAEEGEVAVSLANDDADDEIEVVVEEVDESSGTLVVDVKDVRGLLDELTDWDIEVDTDGVAGTMIQVPPEPVREEEDGPAAVGSTSVFAVADAGGENGSGLKRVMVRCIFLETGND